MAEEGRPRRRCARSKPSALPSAVHYVGYVEDDETPESIMRKFEELEKVRAAGCSLGPEEDAEEAGAQPNGFERVGQAEGAQEAEPPGGLTDAQLMEVFKQTSIFNVRSALAGNEVLLGGGDTVDGTVDRAFSDYDSEDEDTWEELRGFWSDEEEEQSLSEHWKRGRRPKIGHKGPRTTLRGAPKSRHSVVTHYNAVTQALIRRKVRTADKDAIHQVRVPNPPLPLSWGRSVEQYEPLHIRRQRQAADRNDENVSLNGDQQHQSVYLEGASASQVLTTLSQEFQGVLINPGWATAEAGAAAVSELAKLPIPRLCPVGFIFIFADKEVILPLTQQLYRWGYTYVENLTWVYMAANNTVLTLPSSYAGRSHLTLFMFRKEGGEGRHIELRHQRNPDVTFDCIRSSTGQPMGVPEETFVAIETLLPTGKGKLLELWAPRDVRRPGWTHFVQDKSVAVC